MNLLRYIDHPDYTTQPPPGFVKALRLGQVSQGFVRDAWACTKDLRRIPTLDEVREWRRTRETS